MGMALPLEGAWTGDSRLAVRGGGALMRVSPCDSNDLLRNPGKGYILYNLKTTNPRLWETAVASYVIPSWQQVQPDRETKYNWSIFDDAIRICQQHRIQLTIGVLCADGSDNQATDVPMWVFDAGARFTRKKIWNYQIRLTYEKTIPVWNDPVFLQKLE